VVTYLTFMPDCRRSGVRIPAGRKRYLFVYIYRRYLINAMLLYIEFLCVSLIVDYDFPVFAFKIMHRVTVNSVLSQAAR